MNDIEAKTILGIGAALLSTFSWALGGILFKQLGEKLEPLGMTWVKSSISVLILGVCLLVLRPALPNMAQFWRLVLSGFIGIAIGDTLFFAALGHLSPLILALLLLAGPDLFSVVLGVLCLGEMPSWQVFVGIFFLVAAISCVVFPLQISDDEKVKTTVLGVVFGLLSLVATSVSMVIAKPALKEMSVLFATCIRMLAGSVSLLLWGLMSGRIGTWCRPFRQGEYGLKFVGTVAIVTIGGFWLSLYAVKAVQLAVASALMSLEPVLILPLLMVIEKRWLTRRECCSGLLTLVGIVLICLFA
ncbi:MAG: DMT family transporter [Victivallales bacterium]|nr:DMT family transporter [Victivallales bacterium]